MCYKFVVVFLQMRCKGTTKFANMQDFRYFFRKKLSECCGMTIWKIIFRKNNRNNTDSIGIKKEGCLTTTQSFSFNLKSNTMKNTVQKYCFFAT